MSVRIYIAPIRLYSGTRTAKNYTDVKGIPENGTVPFQMMRQMRAVLFIFLNQLA